MDAQQTVYIVDDDAAIRRWLCALMESRSIRAELFSSALEFIEQIKPGCRGCLISDIRMPHFDGLELLEQLKTRGVDLPVIFISAYADVPMAVRAIKLGAFEFLEKPVREQALLEVLQGALDWDQARRLQMEDQQAIQARLNQLTHREQTVLPLIVEGQPNKVIARQLGICEKTVEIHRARIMAKLEVKSVAKLVQLVLQANSGK